MGSRLGHPLEWDKQQQEAGPDWQAWQMVDLHKTIWTACHFAHGKSQMILKCSFRRVPFQAFFLEQCSGTSSSPTSITARMPPKWLNGQSQAWWSKASRRPWVTERQDLAGG